jgi:hypothetical protein
MRKRRRFLSNPQPRPSSSTAASGRRPLRSDVISTQRIASFRVSSALHRPRPLLCSASVASRCVGGCLRGLQHGGSGRCGARGVQRHRFRIRAGEASRQAGKDGGLVFWRKCIGCGIRSGRERGEGEIHGAKCSSNKGFHPSRAALPLIYGSWTTATAALDGWPSLGGLGSPRTSVGFLFGARFQGEATPSARVAMHCRLEAGRPTASSDLESARMWRMTRAPSTTVSSTELSVTRSTPSLRARTPSSRQR